MPALSAGDRRRAPIYGVDLGGGLRRVYRYSEENVTLPLIAAVNTYYSGGYIIDLPPKRRDAMEVIEMLQRDRFLSVETRVVIIDFTLYNAPTNNFCVVRLAFESLATGGVVPHASIQTLRLLPYEGSSGSLQWALDVVSRILAPRPNIQIQRPTDRPTNRQTDRPIDRATHPPTGQPTDLRTNRSIHPLTHPPTHVWELPSFGFARFWM